VWPANSDQSKSEPLIYADKPKSSGATG
jgi:hypothetical protein